MIGRAPTGKDEILKKDYNSKKFNIFVRYNEIVIESEIESIVNIYNISGKLVKTVKVEEGENVVNNIDKGVYIIEGKKIML